jgi:lysophospholipase L1-like esterase
VRRRALLVCCAALTACSRDPGAKAIAAVPKGATVLALGDSITFGTGADAKHAYPEQLAMLSGWNVVNGGVPGDTAAQALARLPALLAAHRPALVIVSVGGNDFLRRLPEADTAAAIRGAAALARDAGAQVLLVAVPQPSVAAVIGAGLADHPLYARLADELKLPLHAGGWSRVLSDPRFRSDAIHANAAGYRAFAEGLAATLREAKFLQP